MHEKVAEYLARQRQKETAFREKKLVEMGLCQREYLPEGTKQTQDVVLEYPYTEGERRYKVVAIPVTDEEWEEICAHTDRGPVRRRNRVSQALWVFGILACIVGAGQGIWQFWYLRMRGDYGMALIQILILWVSAGVQGTLLLGISEIIRLLDRQK